MNQMNEIILGQELERDRIIGTDTALRLERILGKVLDNMRQIPVVAGPKRDQTCPGHLLNGLQADTTFLIVARVFERALERGANEALMVVGCRVNQVPDHLLTRPAPGTNGRAAIGFADLQKAGLAGIDQAREFCTEI